METQEQPATPRTDAAVAEWTKRGVSAAFIFFDFARQLERELAEAKEQLARQALKGASHG